MALEHWALVAPVRSTVLGEHAVAFALLVPKKSTLINRRLGTQLVENKNLIFVLIIKSQTVTQKPFFQTFTSKSQEQGFT